MPGGNTLLSAIRDPKMEGRPIQTRNSASKTRLQYAVSCGGELRDPNVVIARRVNLAVFSVPGIFLFVLYQFGQLGQRRI
jgi:hypothetical protein